MLIKKTEYRRLVEVASTLTGCMTAVICVNSYLHSRGSRILS